MFLHTKKIIISLTTISIILTGCGGGSSSNTTNTSTSTNTSTTANTPTTSHKAIQTGQVKDFNTGKGIKNVTVSIGDSTTITDEEGYYTLNNIAENDKAVVTIKSSNSYTHSIIIAIKEFSEGTTDLSPNYLEYALDNYDHQETYNSEIEKLIKTSSNASIKLSASEYADINNKYYVGNINVKINYQDISTETGKAVFPGEFKGKNINNIIVPFISYGFVAIDLEDNNNSKLHITNDATITFPASINRNEDTIPLWYYNYKEGIWIEEGYAQRQTDGSYKGTISHLGTWNLSNTIEEEVGIYRARIIYSNGNPVRDARVYAVGQNWVTNDLSTDEDGIFELKVVPGEKFKLKAYNYKWKYDAAYQGTLPAISSGEIVENRI